MIFFFRTKTLSLINTTIFIYCVCECFLCKVFALQKTPINKFYKKNCEYNLLENISLIHWNGLGCILIVVYFCSYFLFAIKLKFMKKFMSLLITNKIFLMNLFGTKLVGDITFRNDVSSRFRKIDFLCTA